MTNQKGDEVTVDFKSQFLSDAERMHQQLGPALCLAKWQQVSLHLTTGMNNSCYHPPLHRIPVDSISGRASGLHNTDHKKQQRRLMLSGKRPDECSYCWVIEDAGNLSDRHYRSGEPWAAEHLAHIQTSTGDEDVIPSYVEVNFNSVCNLSCSYCSPQFSSTWAEEIAHHGAYPTSTPHNHPDHFTTDRRVIPNREINPYVDAFWSWWPELYPHLKHIRMTGGEPLLDRNTYRIFDHVLANPKPDLHLNVTSNLSVDGKNWQKYLSKVKQLCDGENIEHFMQYVSLDTTGPQAEYIRYGLDFNLLWDRVNQFLTEIPGRNSITFIITMNNLSVGTMDTLFAAILGLRQIYSNSYQRVWFDTPLLKTPTWQSIQLLPQRYADKLDELWAWMIKWQETPENRFKGFKDYEIARLDRDIDWMRQGQQLDPGYIRRNKADFYRFFREHDRRRGTNFLATFADMHEWWSECEYHARNS